MQHQNATASPRFWVCFPSQCCSFVAFYQWFLAPLCSQEQYARHMIESRLLPCYQSLQAGLVLGMTPVLNRLFRHAGPSQQKQIVIGMGLCSSPVFMSDTSMLALRNGVITIRVSPLWLISSYT